MKKILILVLFLCFGLLCGYFLFQKKIPQRQIEILGFAPFWLNLDNSQVYEKYITSYAFFALELEPDGHIKKLANPQEREPGWNNLISDKIKNKLESAKKANLKTVLTVHLSNEDDINELLKNPLINAKNLTDDIIPLIEDYEFDEVNIDIESFIKASQKKQQAFTDFFSALATDLKPDHQIKISIDITPTALVQRFLTDPVRIGQIADSVILMTYDYHYIGSPFSGPVAPIGGATIEREFDVETAIKEAVKILPAEKIILGIPLYGYEWETLSDSPQSAAIPAGASIASAKRVEEILQTCKNCKKGRGKYSQQPYVIFPSKDAKYYHQIFYEDKQSLSKKLELVNEYNLAGVALWALGYEDSGMLEALKY